MSFSIFSSKLSQIIAIFSVVLLGCFLLTSGALKAYIFLKTTNNYYVQEIGSKARHMGLNYNDTSPDIVFVGSSRTEYHINTSVFKEGGVNAYNYGMSGGDLANFPYMVKQAISVKPKYIVISLPAYKVLDDDLQIDDGLHADDVKMLLSLPFNKQQKLKGLASFVAGINTIRIYSEAINGKIKSPNKRALVIFLFIPSENRHFIKYANIDK